MRANLETFVKWKDLYRRCAPNGKLNMHGAKAILEKLRECPEDEIRDTDSGVAYILGLTKRQFGGLMHRCPPGAWGPSRISSAGRCYSGPWTGIRALTVGSRFR